MKYLSPGCVFAAYVLLIPQLIDFYLCYGLTDYQHLSKKKNYQH